MSKKIIALNGSANKHRNSASMLDSFIEGIRAVSPDAEIERVDVFDLDYKGCRGCMGCGLKSRKGIGCVQRDGASELLERMRAADGIVFATPVYFWEPSAQLKCLLERFIYPGELDHHIEIAAIYTMYQPESVSEVKLPLHAQALSGNAKGFLKNINWTELAVNQTQTWESGKSDIYISPGPEAAAISEEIRAKRWPSDLERGKKAGAEFAKRLAKI